MDVFRGLKEKHHKPLVGRVGVEPTHQKGTDLQSAATLRLRRLPIYAVSRVSLLRYITAKNYSTFIFPFQFR